jgi:hypothetical protein
MVTIATDENGDTDDANDGVLSDDNCRSALVVSELEAHPESHAVAIRRNGNERECMFVLERLQL